MARKGADGSSVAWAAFLALCIALSPQFLGSWAGPTTPTDVLHWTPFSLDAEQKRWVEATLQLKVPALCSAMRKRLTLEIAVGLLANGIEGDFVEAGVAKGGTTILMMKALQTYDPDASRRLWAADSFRGLPDPTAPDLDGGMKVGQAGQFSYDLGTFVWNFKKFGAYDLRRLRILEGWFKDTLPSAGIRRVAFLRLDGDLYASTDDALRALYDKVPPGGVIYVDDYGSWNGCRRAVDEFRRERRIDAPLMWQYASENRTYGQSFEAVFWVKQRW